MGDHDCCIIMFREKKRTDQWTSPCWPSVECRDRLFFKHAIQALPSEVCPLAKARSRKDGGAMEEVAVK